MSSVEECLPFIDGEPRLFSFIVVPNDVAIRRFNADDVVGQGCDDDGNSARLKALAEYYERLSLFNPQDDSIASAVYDGSDSMMDPGELCDGLWISKAAFELDERLIREEVSSWTSCWDVLKDRPIQVPAQLVYLRSFYEPQLCREQNTNGAALGLAGSDEAFERGLLECFERDACLTAYYTQRGLLRIADLPAGISDLSCRIEACGLELHVFHVANPFAIPVAMAVTLDRTGRGPAVTVGASARTNFSRAIRRAVLESIQSRPYGRVTKRRTILANEIDSADDRFEFWASTERIEAADSWIETADCISFRELSTKEWTLSEVLKKCRDRNLHVLAANVSLPSVLAAGFEVVKVIVPELQPLFLSERAKILRGQFDGESLQNPNIVPHPFV